MQKIDRLLRFLAQVSTSLEVGDQIYCVGGAVRNHLMGVAPKDVDIVVDSIALKGKDSEWFARQLQAKIPTRTSLVTNQYGVAILTVSGPWVLDGHSMEGEVLEIANARRESYGDPSGKGYKPHLVEPATILDDLLRRDFTFNTLLWRLSSLKDGPSKAEVLDLLECGRQHLQDRLVVTPVSPDQTFSDDPTRMLRAVKFAVRYGFSIPTQTFVSIQENAHRLTQMPWDAVRKIVSDDLFESSDPREAVRLLNRLGLAEVLKEMLTAEPGFATALGRSLTDQDVHLSLDLLELGWPIRTPVSFLPPAELIRLREVLESHDSQFGKRFLEFLRKPPIDQIRLFTQYRIVGQERGKLLPVVRSIILRDPELIDNPGELVSRVENQVAKLWTS